MNHHHHAHGPHHHGNSENHRPYWRRAHTDWRIWVAVILMMVAMFLYLMTDYFPWLPRTKSQTAQANTLLK